MPPRLQSHLPHMASETTPLITAVIPNWNGIHYLESCLAALHAQKFPPEELEVIVVDNGSTDGSRELVRRMFPAARIIENDSNVGFVRAINQGFAAAHGWYLLPLNNDAELRPGALRRLCEVLHEGPPELAGVQPLLLWAGDPQVVDSAGIGLRPRFHAHESLHGQPVALAPTEPREIWGVCFACVLLRRDVVQQLGGLDPDYFAEWDDVDFCTRARWLGRTFRLIPEARALHHRSPTSRRDPGAKTARLRRNQMLTFLKSLPLPNALWMIGYHFRQDLGMSVHYLKKGMARGVLQAWLGTLRLAPTMIRRRVQLQRMAVLSSREMQRQIQRFTRP